ncbi:hypothetical protein ACN20G_15885 [Streptomyces sp. BI20]|uniref:hypothetical protein n=1 Tax=Streptomyces sp. BI20 TaxID=3403460 RepID=UPI003C73C2A7
MTGMKRSHLVIASCVALAAATGTITVALSRDEGNPPARSVISQVYEADFSDDANLAGGAEDLFYGKVTALKGQKDLGIGAETQYAVEVQRVFKGDVKGVVVVNQQGGTDADGNVVDLPEGDTLLRVGGRYLFATKYNADQRFNTLIPVHGDQPVPDGEAPAPGVPDANGDGQATMSDRWELAVREQNDLSTPPSPPEPTEQPPEDPAPEAG